MSGPYDSTTVAAKNGSGQIDYTDYSGDGDCDLDEIRATAHGHALLGDACESLRRKQNTVRRALAALDFLASMHFSRDDTLGTIAAKICLSI